MKSKPPICLLDYKISWKTFKTLQKKLVRDSGLIPLHGDKFLWQMTRDKEILCYFDPLVEGDMLLGFELPKGRDITILSTPAKSKTV